MYKYLQQFDSIKKVEITRETDHFVWLKDGRKDKKTANWRNYFDTYEEAKMCIIITAVGKVDSLKYHLQIAEVELEKAKALEEN